jgi:hypothetical protein
MKLIVLFIVLFILGLFACIQSGSEIGNPLDMRDSLNDSLGVKSETKR